MKIYQMVNMISQYKEDGSLLITGRYDVYLADDVADVVKENKQMSVALTEALKETQKSWDRVKVLEESVEELKEELAKASWNGAN